MLTDISFCDIILCDIKIKFMMLRVKTELYDFSGFWKAILNPVVFQNINKREDIKC